MLWDPFGIFLGGKALGAFHNMECLAGKADGVALTCLSSYKSSRFKVPFFSNVREWQEEHGGKKSPVPGTLWVFSRWFP